MSVCKALNTYCPDCNTRDHNGPPKGQELRPFACVRRRGSIQFNLFRWFGLRSIDPEHPELFGYKLPNIDRWEWDEETKRCLANRYTLHSI